MACIEKCVSESVIWNYLIYIVVFENRSEIDNFGLFRHKTLIVEETHQFAVYLLGIF